MVDNCILLKGMVYIIDVGMMGLYDGIFGMDREMVIKWFKINFLVCFIVVEGKIMLSGVFIDIDD